jgi:hypothetical protein
MAISLRFLEGGSGYVDEMEADSDMAGDGDGRTVCWGYEMETIRGMSTLL